MDPPKPTSPPPNSSPKPSPQPSSSSKGTSIAVGTGTPEDEEDPYAAAGLTSPASVAATGQPGSFITAGRDSTSVGDDSSAFAADMRAYPASMTSSIRAHVYEGGLRYHAYRDGKYAFPNDEVEQNRDDMKHTMTLMLCRGRHFYSPIEERLKEGGSCLDLGRLTPYFCFVFCAASWICFLFTVEVCSPSLFLGSFISSCHRRISCE